MPFTYPIQIPASGGSFEFIVAVINNEMSAQEVDGWTCYEDPLGVMSDPLMGPATAMLDPGPIGWHRVQNVAGTAIPGVYTYIANVGEYPDEVYACDSFEFEKLETGDGPWVGDWNNWGDPFGDEVIEPEMLPEKFVLNGAYPNPFNPSTTINFAMPEAARVTLTVYDVQGRVVAEVIDGWREAGTHEVLFDGSGLASGVYVYKLKANQFSATAKMVLMK
jgi:hypothetical protein